MKVLFDQNLFCKLVRHLAVEYPGSVASLLQLNQATLLEFEVDASASFIALG
jgi:hypothetical protein